MSDAITYSFLNGSQYKTHIRCTMDTIEHQFAVRFIETHGQATIRFCTDHSGNYQLEPELYDLLTHHHYPDRFLKYGNLYRSDQSEDLLATIIFKIQAMEEKNPLVFKDDLGRCTFDNTITEQQHNPIEDTVSPLIKWFLSAHCRIAEPRPRNPRRVLLSHDIDFLNSGFRQEYNHFFKKPSISLGIRLLQHLTATKKIWSNIEEIIELEKSYGARSVFYLLPQQQKFQHIHNADYSLKTLNKVSKLIFKSGFEVGLHRSLNGTFADEITKFTLSKPLSNRNHYLRYTDIHHDWLQAATAGIKIETGFGWSDSPGYRNGYPLPFYVPNEQSSKMLVVPLVLMDTIYDRKGRIERIEEDLWRMIEQAEDGFTFSILFHNNLLTPWSNKAILDTYEHILAGLKERKVSFTTLAELGDLYGV